jgi:hypothetical protein
VLHDGQADSDTEAEAEAEADEAGALLLDGQATLDDDDGQVPHTPAVSGLTPNCVDHWNWQVWSSTIIMP